MRKKITIVIIITVLMFNMIIPNYIFAGDVGTLQDVMKHQIDIDAITEEGFPKIKPASGERKEEIKETASTWNTIGSAVTTLFVIPAKTINVLLSIFVYTFQDQSQHEFKVTDVFTIEDLVMGRYTIFDIDVFNTEGDSESISTLKKNIAVWYGVCRNIALVIGLLILIYLGIRIAITSTASDQAKYKKMLTSWLTSMIILFCIHYFAIFFMEVQKQILEIFKPLTENRVEIEDGVEKEEIVGFEEYIMNDTWESLQSADGFNKVQYLIIYYVMLYYQLKFAYLYFKRFLSVGFLITIAPLVTITYSVDKAGDNKAQAFSAWLKEIVINIFIQVLHAVVYLVFIYSAAEIAKEVPFFGIMFLMALSRGEKLVRKTFAAGGEGLSDVKIFK